MEIFAYGEDSLTLWAIQHKLPIILQFLNDPSDVAQCQVFFRPSFGRRGGENSSQFGEFDFIMLTESAIYLGESKWQRSSEKILNGVLQLRKEQVTRHLMFKFYVEEWAFGNYVSWESFKTLALTKLLAQGQVRMIPSEDRQLAKNLQTILDVIKQRYLMLPIIKNVLLFLQEGNNFDNVPQKAGTDFEVIPIDYSDGLFKGFIRLYDKPSID